MPSDRETFFCSYLFFFLPRLGRTVFLFFFPFFFTSSGVTRWEDSRFIMTAAPGLPYFSKVNPPSSPTFPNPFGQPRLFLFPLLMLGASSRELPPLEFFPAVPIFPCSVLLRIFFLHDRSRCPPLVFPALLPVRSFSPPPIAEGVGMVLTSAPSFSPLPPVQPHPL